MYISEPLYVPRISFLTHQPGCPVVLLFLGHRNGTWNWEWGTGNMGRFFSDPPLTTALTSALTPTMNPTLEPVLPSVRVSGAGTIHSVHSTSLHPRRMSPNLVMVAALSVPSRSSRPNTSALY